MFIAAIATHISFIFEDIHKMRCFLLGIEACVAIFKGYLLYALSVQIGKTRTFPHAWIFLFVALLCSIFEDFTWTCSLLKKTWTQNIDYRIIIFLIRVGWSLNIIMYQAIALFLESFVQRNLISLHQKIFSFISIITALIFFGFSILYFNITDITTRPPFEFTFFKFATIYGTFILIPLALIYTWIKIKKSPSQKILKKQLFSFTQFIIIPYILLNFWVTFSFDPKTNFQSIFAQAGVVIFMTLALYYTLKKIIHLRFLNFHTHVRASHSFNFVHDFKTILDNLSSATSINEMKLLTQRFFNQAFAIPMGCIYLKIRNETEHSIDDTSHITVERFISTIHQQQSSADHPEKHHLRMYLKNNRILVFDEVEFDHYYQTNDTKTTIIEFLDAINADIFIPIYEQNSITAYIVVERFARPEKLYTDTECDEMIVFANYLAKIINLLQNRNLTEMLKQRKDILEELYCKHQEINQYKESIRSFLKNHESGSGIVLYKNKRFNLINKEAYSLLIIDPNKDEGHPLTKQLNRIVQQTFLYQNNHIEAGINGNKKKIIISSTLLSDYNALLITINYPEIYDTIKTQIDNIKDPSNWDYLLYLETTQTGMLINQLIPGNGETLLNFKIELLKLALSKKAILLDLPEEDLQSTIEILHHISLREQLHILDLTIASSHQDSTAIKLFGINPLYGKSTTMPLLEKLNKTGTLFIKNIHLLDLETQETLAQFIKYGFYNAYKSQKFIQHDVRIICSSHANLVHMVQEKTFSLSLFNELKKASLSMPSLLTLPATEMNQLVEGFAQQVVSDSDASNFLTLSHNDHNKIENQRPLSLHELKKRTQQLLITKSKKQDMYEEELFKQDYTITDPQLAEISRLGKSALKDPKTLHLLWHKFKNQNKIALFLGVNRSSINRRLKEYNIQ